MCGRVKCLCWVQRMQLLSPRLETCMVRQWRQAQKLHLLAKEASWEIACGKLMHRSSSSPFYAQAVSWPAVIADVSCAA